MSQEAYKESGQDLLILDYMNALLTAGTSQNASLQSDRHGTLKPGLELSTTINIRAFIMGKRRATKYEAMLILLTNIHLVSTGVLGRKLSSSIMRVSAMMVGELSRD